MESTIRIIAVGGTIDAEKYDFTEGRVIQFGDPAAEQILKMGRVRYGFSGTKYPVDEDADIYILEQKDSLDMTDNDRMRILVLCLLEKRKRILITHGTDTMPVTGRLLLEHVEGKTIVLTGAMRPNASDNSDAAFNFGGAYIACQTLPPGVYIVLQGEVFPVDQVKKVRDENDPHFEYVPKDMSAIETARRSVSKFVSKLIEKASVKKKNGLAITQIPLSSLVEGGTEDMPGVKEKYYTAGYPPDSTERYLGPMNHTHTYILDGGPYGISGDILLRTGNNIIGLKPAAQSIVERGADKTQMFVVGCELSKQEVRRVLRVSGTAEKYQKGEWTRGFYLQRTESILKAIWYANKQ